jgi:hypothetical protein
MKITYSRLLFCFALSIFVMSSCKKNAEPIDEGTPFELTDNYIAGTITPKSGSYSSVYFIKLLQGNKGVFISSGNDFTGDYTLSKDSLIFTVSDPNNYRIVKFAINSDHKLTSAYYRALTTEYAATGQLLKIESSNQLAGKSFKGEEFKLGALSNKKDLVYRFNTTGTSYGQGVDASAIDVSANSFELINNSAFKYKSGSTVELGFIANKTLTVFRLSGLYYYGSYAQQ